MHLFNYYNHYQLQCLLKMLEYLMSLHVQENDNSHTKVLSVIFQTMALIFQTLSMIFQVYDCKERGFLEQGACEVVLPLF